MNGQFALLSMLMLARRINLRLKMSLNRCRFSVTDCCYLRLRLHDTIGCQSGCIVYTGSYEHFNSDTCTLFRWKRVNVLHWSARVRFCIALLHYSYAYFRS